MQTAITLKWGALVALVTWHGLLQAAVVVMVLDVKGQASITYAGRTSAAQIATSLQEDTRVDVGAGGQVSLVHYVTREQLTVSGPAVVMVTARSIDPVSGAQGQSRKLADGEARVATNYRGRVAPGALTMRGLKPAIELLYPNDGETLLDPARAITWEALDPKAKVQVKLFADDKQVAEQTVTGTSVAAARLGALSPGIAYRVLLSAGDDKPVEAKFTVARAEQRDALAALKPKDRTSVEAWVLYAMALEADAVVSEAKEAWRVVAQLRPEAAGLVRRMAR